MDQSLLDELQQEAQSQFAGETASKAEIRSWVVGWLQAHNVQWEIVEVSTPTDATVKVEICTTEDVTQLCLDDVTT